jgi:hypothetical protein
MERPPVCSAKKENKIIKQDSKVKISMDQKTKQTASSEMKPITKKTYADIAAGRSGSNNKTIPKTEKSKIKGKQQKVRFTVDSNSKTKPGYTNKKKSKSETSKNETSKSENPKSSGLPDGLEEKIENLLNFFLLLYNTKHQTIGTFFENINEKDPQSTNDKMETFYEYMNDHKNLLNEDMSSIDVYDENTDIQNPNDHDVYALIVGDDCDVKYKSLSYISLLIIGSQNAKRLGKNWNIIKFT